MALPGILGDWDALTPEEQERLELAVAILNQTAVNARHEDTMETLTANYLAARQDTLGLLQQFTDDHLAASAPTVVGDQAVGGLFAGRAGHATEHMTSIADGLHRDM